MHHRRRLLAATIVAVCLTVPASLTAAAEVSPGPVTSTSLVRVILAEFSQVIWPTIVQDLGSAVSSAPVPLASSPRKLPSNLDPSLNDPTGTKPRSYSDGCHRLKGQTTVKTCIYGDRHGTKSVVIFGDSHAAMWLPALDSIAARRGWKLYSVTKSACPVARVAHDQPGHSTADCDTWRKNAQTFIAGIHPDLVIAASVERQGMSGQPSYTAWDAGMLSSLTTLVRHAGQVAVLGETPRFQVPVPTCLARHRKDTRHCDSPRSFALSSRREGDDRATAAAAGALYVRVDDITCPGSPCASVIGRYMVSYDDHHMSPAFVMHLIPQFEAKLPTP